MKRLNKLKQAFGWDDSRDFAVLPPKFSNIQIARIFYCKHECTYCFPHGWETRNSTLSNCQRSWKRFRRTQWKMRSC
ncbi:MAG: hypothetical protein ACRYFX_28245 [Janthinobacterium lividum]